MLYPYTLYSVKLVFSFVDNNQKQPKPHYKFVSDSLLNVTKCSAFKMTIKMNQHCFIQIHQKTNIMTLIKIELLLILLH